jgi:adenine-specific DNA methylase
MVAGDRHEQDAVGEERYRQGLPGYHDPMAGVGGAPLALSALTLRLCLAVAGVLTCTALAIVMYVMDIPVGFVLVLAGLVAVGVIDVAVIVRRKGRGEPG